ncbi:hypothetical protein E0L01_09245 [Megamonas funiformis]|uniref:hypothetical protein n=1 Tax=Megamonas funiformis TaxID=437897 RepID=UPI00142FDDDD|nr:hypothetical protein [Megamonas funiformis]NJE28956.1 hypothetical protein [Megamonas funiformis]
MKNKHLIQQFMEENGIEFNKPFWVKSSNNEVKYKIIEKEEMWGTIPKIKFYSNKGEWEETDLSWLLLIIFCEGYEIIPPKQKPKNREEFWYITPNGNIYSVLYNPEDTSDIALFLMSNCFKTKKEAEQNKEKILKILRRNEPLIDLKEMQ